MTVMPNDVKPRGSVLPRDSLEAVLGALALVLVSGGHCLGLVSDLGV